MRVWREGKEASAAATAQAVEAAKARSTLLVEEKALRRKAATQQLKDEILNLDAEDTRNDTPAVDTGLAKKLRKKKNRISIGRNQSATTRDTAPPAAPTKETNNTLSRLLFSKQHMEQRDQVKVVYRQFGPDAEDVLAVEKDDGMPSPEAPDHVVVKVQASTVSLDDCLMRRGFDFDVLRPMCLPLTPGMDVVGHICACGSKVNPAFKEGDRVAALVRTGGNARFISVSSESLVKVPKAVDSAEAVAMVAAFTTAYQTLKRIQQTGPMFSLLGKRVLILGGLSGVGQALIQMCVKARAEIYVPCPHNQQAYLVNVLGAHPLPIGTDQWLHLVAGQMDYVFDGMCEDGLESSFKALNKEGEIICFGHMSMLKERSIGILGAPISAHVNKMWCLTKARSKSIDIWESFQADPETFKKNLKSLCQLLKWNKIKPNIARCIGLSEVADAQSKLESGDLYGTVVCLPWKNEEAAMAK